MIKILWLYVKVCVFMFVAGFVASLIYFVFV